MFQSHTYSPTWKDSPPPRPPPLSQGWVRANWPTFVSFESSGLRPQACAHHSAQASALYPSTILAPLMTSGALRGPITERLAKWGGEIKGCYAQGPLPSSVPQEGDILEHPWECASPAPSKPDLVKWRVSAYSGQSSARRFDEYMHGRLWTSTQNFSEPVELEGCMCLALCLEGRQRHCHPGGVG